VEIASYNIQFGRGLDRNIALERICRSIEGAEIICLQEVEVGWQRSGGADQPPARPDLRSGQFIGHQRLPRSSTAVDDAPV